MTIEIMRAGRRVSAAAPRAERIERKLGRFRDDVQTRVRQTAARHDWIADLAVSFPALLFALAYPRTRALGDAGSRAVMGGAPLAKVAAAADVPLWLRGFAPEAFAAPIPALPDSSEFRRRIANHFPNAWRFAPRWLDSVALAARVADEDVAVWMAREAPNRVRKRTKRQPRDYRRLVAFWAYLTKSDAKAGAVAKTKWNAEMQWAAAQTAALDWCADIAAMLELRAAPVTDVWLTPATIEGYSFVPLITQAELTEEGATMQHCAGGYGPDIADNRSRVWSVRRDGARVATLCLGAAFPSAPFPHIVELSGPKNDVVDPAVWLAARRWVHAHDALPVNRERIKPKTGAIELAEPADWRAMWRDYWLAKRRIPDWLPLARGDVYLI